MPARIDALLDELVKRGGAALHVAPESPAYGRVRGALEPLGAEAVGASAIEEMVFALLAPSQRERLVGERRLTFAVERSGIRYRASVARTTAGLALVVRSIPTRVPSLPELGSPEAIWKLADARRGLVLVVGPPSSGRSTTAAALVDHVNKTRVCTVSTIEDPIEVVHEERKAHIVQREVGRHVASREAGLRDAPREDAEVVYVADVATAAEVRLACELAASGVLVVATCAASGVVDALERFVERDSPDRPGVRAPLADALLAVVGQRLLPTEAGKSVVAHEILLGGPTVATAIREGHMPQLVSVMQSGAASGMCTHDMALERLLQVGRITAETALDVASDREVIAKIVARGAGSRKPS